MLGSCGVTPGSTPVWPVLCVSGLRELHKLDFRPPTGLGNATALALRGARWTKCDAIRLSQLSYPVLPLLLSLPIYLSCISGCLFFAAEDKNGGLRMVMRMKFLLADFMVTLLN
ncbi:hypothetical protein TEQG_06015 [Trichophyton equinum CBS 127.97]|uniref:Uncharacterized protein n=1 Tax=Trichophyton equinum (strain ATCC MYA-4606 / CBS 127.97) TaxID=559882 RepID=F2PYJ5_TRIEC|nr:hypothetical protein TEQG_06015 [Trichophyton equinum CBS 127.97]